MAGKRKKGEGTVRLRKDGRCQADGKVFVAGDIAKGDKTAVWAVRKGKAAAYAIHNYLGGK